MRGNAIVSMVAGIMMIGSFIFIIIHMSLNSNDPALVVCIALLLFMFSLPVMIVVHESFESLKITKCIFRIVEANPNPNEAELLINEQTSNENVHYEIHIFDSKTNEFYKKLDHMVDNGKRDTLRGRKFIVYDREIYKASSYKVAESFLMKYFEEWNIDKSQYRKDLGRKM